MDWCRQTRACRASSTVTGLHSDRPKQVVVSQPSPALKGHAWSALHLDSSDAGRLQVYMARSGPGLERLQQATWQSTCPEPPAVAESVSPDLKQAALLVRPKHPALQIRNLAAGSAVTAFVPLPPGCKPFGLPLWSPTGAHISVLYQSTSKASTVQHSVLILRLADQATQRAQQEVTSGNSPTQPDSYDLSALWAPSAPTLLIVRKTGRQQTRTCFRRSKSAAVGCQVVYHDANGACEAQLHWSPDSTMICYRIDPCRLAVHYISTGITTLVDPGCGKMLQLCWSAASPSSHLLCCGKAEGKQQKSAQAAFITSACPASAEAAFEVPGDSVLGIAWASTEHVAIACDTNSMQAGILSLFRVTDGPALQPLYTMATTGVVEDLAFSADGAFLSFLDQGSDWSMPGIMLSLHLKPESEVVVVHTPSLQVRRFGSRKEGRELCHSDTYMTIWPLGVSFHEKWPGRAMLWWQGTSLQSYGPGLGMSQSMPGPHQAMAMRDAGMFPGVNMPCERLDLG